MERTRTYSWSDPRELAAKGKTMSGLEFIRSLLDGDIGRPPMTATLDFSFVLAEEGLVELECSPAEYMFNPIGAIAGGVACTLMDAAAGCAVQTTLPAGTGYTTVDLTAHYLRPVTPEGGPLRAVGTVINRGRRTALGNAEVRDRDDRLLAHATSSCMLFSTEG